MKNIPIHKTKIIATIGPASRDRAVLKDLILAGVDVFRLNFSHGSHEEHAETIAVIHSLNDELNTFVGILADLQGPKIRTGIMPEGGVEIQNDDIVYFHSNEDLEEEGHIYVKYDNLASDIKGGQRILLDDGKIILESISVDNNKVKAKVIHGGTVLSRKGVNLPDTDISIPTVTEKDTKDLNFILTQPVNWIALSFVRTAQDIINIKKKIKEADHLALVVAKVEKPDAILNIDPIIDAADAVMIARGDLGVEIPLERVPILQKDITQRCINKSKPVIIATQMMESMITNASPTRAEVTDVANAIFDGADAVMLSGETAMGEFPVRVIETFVKIMDRVEKQEVIYNRHHQPSADSETFVSDVICFNACKIATDLKARAVIGMTMSGYTGFMLSSFRPNTAIYVFTDRKDLLNTMSLCWGVRAFYYDKLGNINTTFADVQNILVDKGLLDEGDVVINTGTLPLLERGRTNAIKVSRITKD